MSVELFLSYDEELDWLTLIEFGQVENAQPPDHWRGVSESFGYILRRPDGPEIGFKIPDFSAFDPEDPEVAEIWEGPRFDVPVLGLRDSTAGEIVLAARPFLGSRSTINRVYFNAAMQTEGEEAEELTFVRTNTRHLAAQRDDSEALGQLWKETFSSVGFFHRDADLADEVLEKYQRGMIIQERAYVDCSYLDSGLAARHRYLIITGKARDLHALSGMDPKYGPAIIQRNGFFKVLDVYNLYEHAQITVLHIPEELIGYVQTPELNEIEKEMVEAARTNFEENLARLAVPALTEAEWLERVAFPLGMSEEGDLFYGSAPEGPS